MADETTFGERLRAARQAAGLSQARLGGDAYSVSYISRLESGRREPTSAVVAHCEDTLGLARGTLLGADWGSTDDVGATDGSPARLAALTSRTMQAWAAGASDSARQGAREAMVLAEQLEGPVVWWQLAILDVQAAIRVGSYAEGAESADALAAHPWVMATRDLHAQAVVLASTAHRLAGDGDAATAAALRAVALTEGYPAGDPVRMNAVVSALSTHAVDLSAGAPGRALLDELARGIDHPDVPHTAGLAAWALGNIAFAEGDVEGGLAWHDRADGLISPATDFRDWVRFARASASERLAAGITAGVGPLLARARLALDALGNPNEAAALALTEADLAEAEGRTADAVEGLRAAVEVGGATPELEARVLLRLAELLRTTGDLEGATSSALRAAHAFAAESEGLIA